MPCDRHPEAVADWTCMNCGSWHCDACIKRVRAGTQTLEACVACGGVLQQAAEAAPDRRDELEELVTRPLSVGGLMAAAGLAVPALMSDLPIPILREALLALYAAVVVAYFIEVIDHVAQGHPGLPVPASSATGSEGLLAMLGRSLVLGMLIGAPYLLVRALGETPWFVDLLTLLVGVSYAPALLIAVAMGHSVLAALWPPGWLRIAQADLRHYGQTTALCLGSFLAFVGVDAVLGFALGWFPLLGAFAAHTVAHVLLLVLPVVVGGYLQAHRTDLA